MNATDIKALRTPLLVLACVVSVAIGAVYYSHVLLGQSQQQLRSQTLRLNDARSRLQRSGDEKEIIVNYLGRYQRLMQLGFVGNEQRINWLDGLRLANQRTDLFGIEYQIGVQQPYHHATEANPASLALLQSSMKLRFRLLHEEDLMRFFNHLSQLEVGIFSLNECDLQRINTDGAIRFQPNLQAECELSWITVKTADAAEKNP
ncbi:MAG: hypothetical protein ACK4N4_10955 [Burkholderiales bacterium]